MQNNTIAIQYSTFVDLLHQGIANITIVIMTSHTYAHSNNAPPQPMTPLRPPSRNSLRSSSHNRLPTDISSISIASLEPVFAELSDSMADLEANFMHLQIMHESLARFGECFASFLYGLNVNAFCVDFPEVRMV